MGTAIRARRYHQDQARCQALTVGWPVRGASPALHSGGPVVRGRSGAGLEQHRSIYREPRWATRSPQRQRARRRALESGGGAVLWAAQWRRCEHDVWAVALPCELRGYPSTVWRHAEEEEEAGPVGAHGGCIRERGRGGPEEKEKEEVDAVQGR